MSYNSSGEINYGRGAIMFEQLNQEKQRYEKNMTLGRVITGIAFVLYLPLGALLGVAAFFIIVIPFLGGAIYSGKYHSKIKALSNDFKQKYIPEGIKTILPDSEYNYMGGFIEDEVIKSGLLRRQDRYGSEDLITGNHKGVRFKTSDVVQKDVKKSEKHTRVVTVFQGRFYRFDFPKKFKYNLQLLQPYNYRPFSGLERVKTESVHFNSEMKIYAQSEHEAFYLLTPHFMEKLLYFDNKYNDKISFSFIDNLLYIAIDSRTDTFDIKPYKIIDESIFKQYKADIEEILELIEVLNLDDKLFRN